MNRRKLHRRAMVLVTSLALVTVLLFLRQCDRFGRAASESSALHAERARLHEFTLVRRDELRAELGRLEAKAAVAVPWPDGWTVASLSPGTGEGTERWRLRHPSPAELPWHEVTDVVDRLTRTSGLRLESLSIDTRGSRHRREFAAMEMIVARTGATPSRRNPSAGTVLPRADGPASPQEIGRGLPLRRPSASAEPAASSPASAPVRPDPLGPRSADLHRP